MLSNLQPLLEENTVEPGRGNIANTAAMDPLQAQPPNRSNRTLPEVTQEPSGNIQPLAPHSSRPILTGHYSLSDPKKTQGKTKESEVRRACSHGP